MKIAEIDRWVAPRWHSDFGDPKRVARLLKDFSYCLIEHDGRFQLNLNCVEEGYMHVTISRNAKDVATLYVVERTSEEVYGLFVGTSHGEGEDEYYFRDVGDGVNKLLSMFR